jgi:hypothetical protein
MLNKTNLNLFKIPARDSKDIKMYLKKMYEETIKLKNIITQ